MAKKPINFGKKSTGKVIARIRAPGQIKYDKKNFEAKIIRSGETARRAILKALRDVLTAEMKTRFIEFLVKTRHMGATGELVKNFHFSITYHASGISISLNSRAKDIHGETYFRKVFYGHQNEESFKKISDWVDYKVDKGLLSAEIPNPKHPKPTLNGIKKAIWWKIKTEGTLSYEFDLLNFKEQINTYVQSSTFNKKVQAKYAMYRRMGNAANDAASDIPF